jgi:hypothetical protein
VTRRGFLAGLLAVPLHVLAARPTRKPDRRTGVYRDVYFDDYARY